MLMMYNKDCVNKRTFKQINSPPLYFMNIYNKNSNAFQCKISSYEDNERYLKIFEDNIQIYANITIFSLPETYIF